MNRIDWLNTAVWLPLLALAGLLLCGVLAGAFSLAQAVWREAGPWVTQHIDGIVSVVCLAGVACIWRLASKDNPTW